MRYTFVLLLIGCFALCSCMVPEPIKDHRQFVREQITGNPSVTEHDIYTDDFRLHYRSSGSALSGIAVWIHGTPGGWDDGARLFVDEELIDQVLMIGLDRPGWGSSQYLDQPRLIPSFQDQADLISLLLLELRKGYPDKPILLVGHSWGGSLVPAIALAYPDLVDSIIIAAGGLDPELTGPRWYSRAGKTWLVNSLLSDAMRGANIEVYALQPELAERMDLWKELRLPVIAIQGEKDELVHPGNADFIEQRFTDPIVVRLPGQGHLLQVERMDLMSACIKALLETVPEDCKEPVTN